LQFEEGKEPVILDKARPGQRGAIQTIIKRAKEGERETGIILPTGYGKRDVIICSGIALYDLGLTCCNLVINPNDFLKRQFIKEDKFAPACERFGLLSLVRPIKYAAIDFAKPEINFAPQGEIFVSSTIQLITCWKKVYVDWVESMAYRHGRPVTIFVDEVQFHSEANKWGEAVEGMLDAGARLVGLTATAERENGERTIGFRQRIVSSEPVKFTVCRMLPPRPDTEIRYCNVSLYEGQKHHIELEPDFVWSFAKAWTEGFLCKMSLRTIDADMKKIDPKGATKDKKLSELSETEVRKVLGKVVRHPEFIREACRTFLIVLKQYRAIVADCAGLVFTLNDQADDAQFNQHAELVKKILKEEGSDHRIVIATTANDKAGSGPSGAKILEHFTDEKCPVGDIAILKQMAGCGLDAARIKIILDLSTVRSVSSVIQRDNRTTRPYKGLMTAVKICPADCLTLAIHEKHVKEPGGEATSNEVELVHSDDYPVQDKEKDIYIFKEAIQSDTHDTKLNVINFEDIPLVNKFIEEFPFLIRDYTIPEIARKAKAILTGAMAPTSEGVVINTGDKIACLKNQIAALSKTVVNYAFARITGRSYTGSGDDQKLYAELSKKYWSSVYARVNEDVGDYKKINTIDTLEKIYSAWEDMIQTGVA
jgi:hypothetical protein